MAKSTVEGKAKSKNGVKRLIICGLAFILQIALVITLATRFVHYAQWISFVIEIVAAILVLAIYSQHKTSNMKMPWIILILLVPLLGIISYALIGISGSTKKMRKRYENVDKILLPCLDNNERIFDELKACVPEAVNTSAYIINNSKYPIYAAENVRYFSDTCEALEKMLEDMSRAEKFIFMEYHAIEDDLVWSRIQEVLVDRVKNGVKVRVFYDDLGSIGFVNLDFSRKLEKLGIECRVFNPFSPMFNFVLNNRDHRKITVVDGKIGYTGGYNIANEYFNITAPYGKWKDSGIRLEGAAVNSLTVTFLEMWNAVKNGDKSEENLQYIVKPADHDIETEGFIQPYADNPIDNEHVGEEVYISIINSAHDYCYFMTPYLILTDEMVHALCLAAKRGVDVRIVTPGIPDKKLVYSVTRSFYRSLVSKGVRVFEWSPGFCHAKMCVCDDIMATCGTINLDYRSLYHHFENGCFIVDKKIALEIKDDLLNSISQSREVTDKYKSGLGAMLRLEQLILRLFAELL